MFLLKQPIDHRTPLDASDADTLSLEAAQEVERLLNHRDGHKETRLFLCQALPARLEWVRSI
ncbi:hypothetical protein ACVIN2_002782 [Bradyrhizobium sp. USDA 3650]